MGKDWDLESWNQCSDKCIASHGEYFGGYNYSMMFIGSMEFFSMQCVMSLEK